MSVALIAVFVLVALALVAGGLYLFSSRLPHAVRALEPSKLALYMLDRRERPTA